jgi:hypothetical protein
MLAGLLNLRPLISMSCYSFLQNAKEMQNRHGSLSAEFAKNHFKLTLLASIHGTVAIDDGAYITTEGMDRILTYLFARMDPRYGAAPTDLLLCTHQQATCLLPVHF